jgi:hypothetical protein
VAATRIRVLAGTSQLRRGTTPAYPRLMADEALRDDATKDGSHSVSISGDCYDHHQMSILLHVSNAQLVELQTSRQVLGLKSADGTTIFPKDQFDLKRSVVVEGLADVLGAIRYVPPDEWQVLAWLRTPRPELGGSSVLDHLKSGSPAIAAIELARNWSGVISGFTGL